MIPAVLLSKAQKPSWWDLTRCPSQSLCVKTDWIFRVLDAPHEPDPVQVFEDALKATIIALQTPVLLTTRMQIVSPSLVCPHKYK